MQRRMRELLFTIALSLIAITGLSAQTVGGTVVERATGEPIQGAVVALVDSLGRRREAVLSDAQGQYSLQAPAPGTYRVRAERVGYAAASSPSLALDVEEQVTQPLSMSPVHVTLDAVVARGVPRACTIRPENGEQAARVWDEARKALDATHLGGRAGAYEFRVRLFRRTLALPRLTIVDSSSTIQSGYSRQPFATPVERLVTHGYMEVEGDSIVFRAPDAPTLLSDAFLDHHCFSLVRGRGTEAGMVGLAFAPLRGRRLPDVQGTLWLDGQTGHLRYLEYTYTRLPFASSDARLGGRVDFVQLPGGGWIVSRWRIRMPVMERENPRAQPIVKALVESGGEVLGVRTGRGTRVPLRTASVAPNGGGVRVTSVDARPERLLRELPESVPVAFRDLVRDRDGLRNVGFERGDQDPGIRIDREHLVSRLDLVTVEHRLGQRGQSRASDLVDRDLLMHRGLLRV